MGLLFLHDGKAIPGYWERLTGSSATRLLTCEPSNIKNSSGQMIQMDNLVTLEEAVAPPQLYRYNRF